MIDTATLLAIYREAIESCDPALLVQRAIVDDDALAPLRDSVVDLVAIGKSAARLYHGAAPALRLGEAFVAFPSGYGEIDPAPNLRVAVGSHPSLSDASFEAGRALLEFLRAPRRPTLFLISGGASATVEWPRHGISRDDLRVVNDLLVRSGFPIGKMNVVRKHLSSIKGGKLREHLAEGSVVAVLSDVDPGDLAAVGSGPAFVDLTTDDEAADILDELDHPVASKLAAQLRERPDSPQQPDYPPHVLLADNEVLQDAAEQAARSCCGGEAKLFRVDEQFTGDVEQAAQRLAATAAELPPHSIVIAGGEVVVRVTGEGRGGRCSELAARFARAVRSLPQAGQWIALFGSSDGSDGNSGLAGVVVDGSRIAGLDPSEVERRVAASDTAALAHSLGEGIIVSPTGNNLRDLYLLARR